MESSPRSTPESPSTRSPSPAPSPLHHDMTKSLSPAPSQTDAQAFSATEEAGDRLESQPTQETRPQSLKGKERARKGPLRLLDLPVDVLKEIIHQLPHTNDLTSLALCHSALHRLTIPCIYSRFDIVWPDESTHTEPRTGVDALTYGLATLVMGDDSFPHQARRRQGSEWSQLPHRSNKSAPAPHPVPRRRYGNYYAQFTKKFSLGNGPPAWVQEYMITKEGGKMLGTLVALAIARMVNLETFVWDMPTGVLRDVWLALSSLADRTDGEECRLERLWIRWHDNTIDAPVPPPAPPMLLNTVPPPPNTTHPSGLGAVQAPVVMPVHYPPNPLSVVDRVEQPTFSVIPPLKSLSVLDIDELPYLDEMSILVARSQRKLRELRIGIAPHAQQRDWVTAWEGDGIQQVDYATTSAAASTISEKRLGGVLGVLVGRVHNLRQSEDIPPRSSNATGLAKRQSHPANAKPATDPALALLQATTHERDPESVEGHSDAGMNGSTLPEGADLHDVPPPTSEHVPVETHPVDVSAPVAADACDKCHVDQIEEPSEPVLNGKLKLETLELERVPLSVSVLLKAFDWSILTTLTLLNCNNHEQLWKSLRRTYSPYPPASPSASNKAYKASYTLRSEYGLSLKKIHTNMVSPWLITFLKETLAPNTLEVLFLQEGRSYTSTVTINAIFRGPLRRHRASLKKLMIDSSEKGPDGHATSSSRWRRWMMTREILTFVTSGRMSSLREVAVSIDYKDWHHFLQRLPLVPHIRSLYIPFIADHAHGNNIDPRELALQILDIVHLRPEIEICYMGIATKCFEILENRPSNYDLRHGSDGHEGEGPPVPMMFPVTDPLMSDEESEITEDEDEEEFETGLGDEGEGDDTGSEASHEDHDDSDDDSFLQDERKAPRLRIREILFYEEKIETLRARHGTLKP